MEEPLGKKKGDEVTRERYGRSSNARGGGAGRVISIGKSKRWKEGRGGGGGKGGGGG